MAITSYAKQATDAEKHAASVFLRLCNEARGRRGLRPVAIGGKAKSVRRALHGYFHVGLTLRVALGALRDAESAGDNELLHPTRLAKMALNGTASDA